MQTAISRSTLLCRTPEACCELKTTSDSDEAQNSLTFSCRPDGVRQRSNLPEIISGSREAGSKGRVHDSMLYIRAGDRDE